MTNGQIVIVAGYAVVVFICLVRHFIWSWAMKATPLLSPRSPRFTTSDTPHVTILVPAKDEERSIRICLESLLRQDYPSFDILVADDRSTDRTGNIVEEFAQREPRVRLVRITHLPEGWTGKTNALQQLQEHATGEFLLFVDADTRMDPSCLSVSIRHMDEHRVDMLSLMPALDARSFWENTVQPFAAMCLMVLYPLPRVNDPANKLMGFANGQFILVRRDAYDAIGQHSLVRDKFVEDIHLGRLIRIRDRFLCVAMAPDLISVRMYATLGEINRGWARILYSGVDAKPARLYLLQALILVFSVLSYVVLLGFGVALLAGIQIPFTWTMLGLGIAHEILQQTMFARIYKTTKSRLDYLVLRPIAVVVMLGVVAKAIRMCRTHQVSWRGTQYDQKLTQSHSTSAAP